MQHTKIFVILLLIHLVQHGHSRHLHQQHMARINVQSANTNTNNITFDAPMLAPTNSDKANIPSNNDQADAPNFGPTPPDLIKLEGKARKNSILLKWHMPTTTVTITDYVVRYGLHIPDDHMAIVKNSLRQHILSDLKPDTDYVISVRARNEAGEGPAKYVKVRTMRLDEQEIDTSKMKLPSPIGLKAETVSPTSVILTWSSELNNHKQPNFIRTVMVRYYINGQSSASNSKNFTTTENKVTLDDLKPNTEYGFAVKTFLHFLDGRYYKDSGWSMDAHTKTSEGEPTVPRDFNLQSFITENGLVDATKVELQWMPPDSSNGELRGYMISYSAEDGNTSKDLEISADVTNYVIQNLIPENRYNFKIRARNNRNSGPFTEAKTYQAPGTATLIPNPAIPLNLIILFVVAILVIIVALTFVVTYLTCRSRKSNKQAAKLATAIQQNQQAQVSKTNVVYGTTASVNRMATIGRRRETRPPDLWINQDQVDTKSTISEKSPSEMNLAMVSIKRDSPKFTTQLAGSADIRFQPQNNSMGHYQTSPPQSNYIYYDETDHLGDIQTLNKRHQQRMQLPPPPSQLQSNTNLNQQMPIITSPHQQPPPPPPLNIEQQSQLYNSGNMHNTRSLRINRPLLYDPVAGSFQGDMVNHVTHHSHHPISTLSRRSSTNTMRSFQTYHSQMMPTMPQAPTPILQNHQAVINQLITTPYPALPLKHVSAVRPQIMSNTQELDMTLEEKSLK